MAPLNGGADRPLTVSAGGVDGDGIVRAAGGVVVRRVPDRPPDVLVVHRPKYDDWSLPKGKLDPGESEAEAAVREVEEETGYQCTLGPELGTVTYLDAKGRPKTVRYWRMELAGGAFTPNREVDEVRWLPLGDAGALLSYERDRRIVESALVEPG